MTQKKRTIRETKDTSTNTKTENITEKTFEEKTDKYHSKKIKSIPWWFFGFPSNSSKGTGCC